MVKLSIIILSYNTKDLILKCIDSIASQYKEQLDKGELEIIVVDNASSDASASQISNLKSQISNLELIENEENVGFSKGNNRGAKAASGKYLLFLNSDTEVLDKNLLGMVGFLEKNEKLGILGAKLVNQNGKDQKSTGKFYTVFNTLLMLFGGEKLGLLRASPSSFKNVDWVSGAALMIRRDLLEKLNGFDEKIFMYMEDMELCYRIKENGFLVGFYPKAKILHKERGSSNREFAIVNIYQSLLYFSKKHRNRFDYLMIKKILALKAIISIFFGILINSRYLKDTYKKALKFCI
ncbi:MAG: glycosyltransferase family 2 protein [Candidatus Levyibacteriota bacterium]